MAKVKGKDLLELLQNKVSEIKTISGKVITKKDIDFSKLKELLK